MKKLNLLYALLFAVIIVACKDDDEDPTFKKEDFVGTWEQDDSADQGCSIVLKIDATKFYDGTKCGTDVETDTDGTTFTFDGKQTFTTATILGDMKYKITSKSATKFTAQVTFFGQNAGTYTYTKL